MLDYIQGFQTMLRDVLKHIIRVEVAGSQNIDIRLVWYIKRIA